MSPECYVMQERGTGIEARRGNLSREAVAELVTVGAKQGVESCVATRAV